MHAHMEFRLHLMRKPDVHPTPRSDAKARVAPNAMARVQVRVQVALNGYAAFDSNAESTLLSIGP